MTEGCGIVPITMGILAHVDAGKTTLSEALLYLSGSIRKMGRVDNRDAFLDTYALERARGITIFSKQARLWWKGLPITLLDTPGHVDFSAEMERTLMVLDYAVLVISGSDGVQGHTATLWGLLSKYRIPTFLFINKMDQPGTSRGRLMDEIRDRLDENCVDFGEAGTERFLEQAALCDEAVLDHFLETGEVGEEDLSRLVRERKLFPCYFGSALKLEGVEGLLEGIRTYGTSPAYPDVFGAKVYKISRDDQGNRLTHMKITGGSLKVKCPVAGWGHNGNKGCDEILSGEPGAPESSGKGWQEKVNQIRLYSGEKYESAAEAGPGIICAVTGLTQTFPGQGLGMEKASMDPVLEPVLTYGIKLPEGCDSAVMLPKMKELEEEEPQLHVAWDSQLQEIQLQLMGEVQTEILRSLITGRFGVEVEFGPGSIVYKETILDPVEGVGHFEPLRHYAEVHLLLEPGERGSGLQFEARCSEDVLDGRWQRLVLAHLEEKQHRGVLIGAPITDMKITLVAGRAHQKHTEGGDFRQATYRALRQGLREARSQILEPWYKLRLEIPEVSIGRAMTDIEKRGGTSAIIRTHGGQAFLEGRAPAASMGDYQTEVTAYTKGCGRLACIFGGYEPCHNPEEVKESAGYDPERDVDNPTGSVFCTHGAGFVVGWDHVKEYMHVDSGILLETAGESLDEYRGPVKYGPEGTPPEEIWMGTEEIDAILERTFYSNSRDKARQKSGIPGKGGWQRNPSPPKAPAGCPSGYPAARKEKAEEYLLVDGYNIIYAWDELNSLAADNMEGARGRLMDLLCNYQAIRRCSLILVFDAYRVKGHRTEILDYHNIHVVFTKEAETADQYIEKFAHENARKFDISVATSDGLEQVIIFGQGCRRVTARELWEDLSRVKDMLREEYLEKPQLKRNSLGDMVPKQAAMELERLKKGE